LKAELKGTLSAPAGLWLPSPAACPLTYELHRVDTSGIDDGGSINFYKNLISMDDDGSITIFNLDNNNYIAPGQTSSPYSIFIDAKTDIDVMFTIKLDVIIVHECMSAVIDWGKPDPITDYWVAEPRKSVDLGQPVFIANASRFTEVCGPFKYTLWTDDTLQTTWPADAFSVDSHIIPLSFLTDTPNLDLFTLNTNIGGTYNLQAFEKNHEIYVKKTLGIFWETTS